eukprot:scaffold6000_cov51-Phaeocystis_antarctica.AAC.1
MMTSVWAAAIAGRAGGESCSSRSEAHSSEEVVAHSSEGAPPPLCCTPATLLAQPSLCLSPSTQSTASAWEAARSSRVRVAVTRANWQPGERDVRERFTAETPSNCVRTPSNCTGDAGPRALSPWRGACRQAGRGAVCSTQDGGRARAGRCLQHAGGPLMVRLDLRRVVAQRASIVIHLEPSTAPLGPLR